MADDTTNLLFEIEQKGAADLEKELSNIEGQVQSNLDSYLDFSDSASKSNEQLLKDFEDTEKSLEELEKSFGSLQEFTEDVFEDTGIDELREQYAEAGDAFLDAVKKGNDGLANEARSQMKGIRGAIQEELEKTTEVYEQHQEDVNDTLEKATKNLDLSQASEKIKGLGQGAQQTGQALAQGDIGGAAETVKGGLQSGGQALKGVGGGSAGTLGKLTSTLGTLSTAMAGVVGSLGAVAAAITFLDGKVKEANRKFLDNVSMTDMMTDNYDRFEEKLYEAQSAVREFKNLALTDPDLHMLGMDPDEMGNIVGSLNEQGKALAEARKEGVGFKEMMVSAKEAALNLNVESSEAMKLIGQQMDIANESFTEAQNTLKQIVHYARESGVTSQKFFNVVQSTVSEMGMFNYQIEETAGLFKRLTNIMDSKSAEEFMNSLGKSIDEAGAAERVKMVVTNRIGKVADMVERRQKQLAGRLDIDAISKGFKKIGAAFDPNNIESSMSKLSSKQKDMLQSAVSDIDQSAGQQIRQYTRLLETSRNNAMELADTLPDLSQMDKLALKIGDLENKLGVPLERMTSVMTSEMGVNEKQLRMLQSLKTDFKGDMARLVDASNEGNKVLQNQAEEMGYMIKKSEEGNKLINEQTGKEIKGWKDLMGAMTKGKEDKMASEVEKQKSIAEETRNLTRTLVETLQGSILGTLQGVYSSVLSWFDSWLDWWSGTTDKEERRKDLIREDQEIRRKIRDERRAIKDARGRGDKEAIKEAEANIKKYKEEMDINRMERRELDKEGVSIAEAKRTAERRKRTGEGSLKDIKDKQKAGLAREMQKGSMSKGTSFIYSGKRGPETYDNFKGTKNLQEIQHFDKKSGKMKRIRGQDAILKFLDKQVNKEKAQRKLQKELKKKQEKGNLTNKEMKKTIDKVHKTQTKKGIKIDKNTLKDMAEEQQKLRRREKLIQALMDKGGWGRMGAENFLRNYKKGKDEYVKAARQSTSGVEGVLASFGVQTPEQRRKSRQDRVMDFNVQPINPKKGEDVKMVTGGIPFLDMQPGDIIVDQKELANTMRGRAGEFVPDLLNKAGGKGGGGGGGSVWSPTFNIYGGDSSQIRNEILKVLEEWRRRRNTG